MLSVGYRIDEIGTKTPSTSIFQEDNSYLPEVKQQYIYVQESDLKDKTEQSIIVTVQGGCKEEEKPPPKSSNKIKQLLKN
jgi:hypothetical protein